MAKKLSPTAERLLGFVREATRRDEHGDLVSFFVPRTTPIREVFGTLIKSGHGYVVGGSGDANALRALERVGLIKRCRSESYWYEVTEAGIAEYDRILARRKKA